MSQSALRSAVSPCAFALVMGTVSCRIVHAPTTTKHAPTTASIALAKQCLLIADLWLLVAVLGAAVQAGV
jgi:hypothetical protein